MFEWINRYTAFLKIGIPLTLFFVLTIFLYGKIAEYRAADAIRQETLAQQLRERNVELEKAQVTLVKVISSSDTKLSQIQKEWIKQHNLEIEQYQELILAYKAHAAGAGIAIITTDNGSTSVAPGSVVIVDNQIVKDWQLSYSDFRIDIDVDALNNNFDYTLHQHFGVNVTKAVDERGNGAYFASVFELDNVGNSIGEVVVKEFNVKEVKPSTKKARWFGSPIQLGLAIGGTTDGTAAPQIIGAYPILTYGYTTVDTQWAIGPYVGVGGGVYSGGLWAGWDIGSATGINLLKGIKVGVLGGFSTDGYIVGGALTK